MGSFLKFQYRNIRAHDKCGFCFTIWTLIQCKYRGSMICFTHKMVECMLTNKSGITRYTWLINGLWGMLSVCSASHEEHFFSPLPYVVDVIKYTKKNTNTVILPRVISVQFVCHNPSWIYNCLSHLDLHGEIKSLGRAQIRLRNRCLVDIALGIHTI